MAFLAEGQRVGRIPMLHQESPAKGAVYAATNPGGATRLLQRICLYRDFFLVIEEWTNASYNRPYGMSPDWKVVINDAYFHDFASRLRFEKSGRL